MVKKGSEERGITEKDVERAAAGRPAEVQDAIDTASDLGAYQAALEQATAPDVDLVVAVSVPMREYLERLVATGLYGKTLGECARRLLEDQLAGMMTEFYPVGGAAERDIAGA